MPSRSSVDAFAISAKTSLFGRLPVNDNHLNLITVKIVKSGRYFHIGKYGYLIICGKQNYKLPEFYYLKK